jgi:hypothetical protein
MLTTISATGSGQEITAQLSRKTYPNPHPFPPWLKLVARGQFLHVVTRNTSHFVAAGAMVVNPWISRWRPASEHKDGDRT